MSTDKLIDALQQLCDELEISPIKLSSVAESMKRDYVKEKEARRIAEREAYVGRYFRISGVSGGTYYNGEDYYCKVISSRSQVDGCVSGMMVPIKVEGWDEKAYMFNKIYVGFSQIDVLDVPADFLKEENEISAEEFARVAHDYVDKLLDLKFD